MSHISKSERCYIAKSALYHFYVKTNILQDLHICISAPLIIICILFQNLNETNLNYLTVLCFEYMLSYAIRQMDPVEYYDDQHITFHCVRYRNFA